MGDLINQAFAGLRAESVAVTSGVQQFFLARGFSATKPSRLFTYKDRNGAVGRRPSPICSAGAVGVKSLT
jgi:hypothetical protein